MSVRRITTIALLSCLAFVLRIVIVLPNVQPVTAIIMLVTIYIGTVDGLLVALISILISNLYLGMGVWTIAQLVTYSIIVLFIGFFVRKTDKKSISNKKWSIIAGIMGLLYGFLISLIQAPFFSWISFFPYWISGLPYDFLHGFGNLYFFFILHPILRDFLIKQKGKMSL